MRVLVTGVTGFAGGHLAEALLARGHEVSGVGREASFAPAWEHLAARVPLDTLDIAEPAGIERVLRETRPEQIYHLAGYAHAGQSFKEPDAAWAGNLTATRTLYDTLLKVGLRPRILYVGSGLIYGHPSSPDQSFHEDCPLRPTNPYAASKAAADLASYQYSQSPGLDIVIARPFNHVGPAQSPQFAVASFARQVAAIAAGRQPPVLETGNLTPRRDLTDVRDVARAYQMLMDKGRTGEAYNIGSGVTPSMQEVLDRLLALAGVRAEVRPRADLLRPTDAAATRADTSKIRRETGWQPQRPLDQTLRDMLAFWRDRA